MMFMAIQKTLLQHNKRIPNCPPAHTHKYRNSFLNKGIVSFSNLSYRLKSANTIKSIVSGFKKAIFDQNNCS